MKDRRETAILSGGIVVCCYLAYSGLVGGDLNGLWIFLLIVAILPLTFVEILDRTAPPGDIRFGAAAGVLWFAFFPRHLAEMSDPAPACVLWCCAGGAASVLLWQWLPELRRFGIFLAPAAAAVLMEANALAMLAPWRAPRPLALEIQCVAALGVAALAFRWQYSRWFSAGLMWYAVLGWTLPGDPAPGNLGLALGISWAAIRVISLLRKAETEMVSIGFAALILMNAAEISGQRSAAFAARMTSRAPSVAVQQAPEADAAKFVNLSLELFRAGKFTEALAAAQEAIRLKPNSAEAYNNLGAIYAAMEQWDAAIEADQKALSIKPNFPLAQNNLTWAVEQKKRAGR